MTAGRNRNGQVLTGLFVTLLALPLLVSLLSPAASVSMSEKRHLAEFPAAPATLEEAGAYPAGFEAWFGDHFGLRAPLGQLHSLTRVKLLGTSPRPGVAVGKDGWLYYGGGPMQAYRGAVDISPRLLANIQVSLEAKRDWLAERGVRYLLVVAPDKQSIYSEHVPFRPLGPTPTDRLLAHLDAHSDVDILDLRPTLLAAKKEAVPLYMKTDSHWNALGAYTGYRAIMRRVSRWVPAPPIARNDAGLVRRASEGGNLADQINLSRFLDDEEIVVPPEVLGECGRRSAAPIRSPEPWPGAQGPFSTHCEGATPAHLLFLRDSFANDLIPFFSRQFSDVTYVWQGTNVHPMWESFSFIGQAVHTQPVDLVIEQVPERKLALLAVADPFFQTATARRQFSRATPEPPRPLRARPAQEVRMAQTPAGLRLRPTGPSPVIELPLGPDRPGRWPVVRLSLTSPAATRLVVLFQTLENKGFLPERKLSVPAPPGRSEVFFEVPSGQVTGSFLLGLGTGEGDFVLHGIEIRAGREDINVPTPARRLTGSGAAGT